MYEHLFDGAPQKMASSELPALHSVEVAMQLELSADTGVIETSIYLIMGRGRAWQDRCVFQRRCDHPSWQLPPKPLG